MCAACGDGKTGVLAMSGTAPQFSNTSGTLTETQKGGILPTLGALGLQQCIDGATRLAQQLLPGDIALKAQECSWNNGKFTSNPVTTLTMNGSDWCLASVSQNYQCTNMCSPSFSAH
jgi:hypothetical protein